MTSQQEKNTIYAVNLIQTWTGTNEDGYKVSLAEASYLISNLCIVLGLNEEETRERLARFYRARHRLCGLQGERNTP